MIIITRQDEREKKNPHPHQQQLIFTSLSPLFSPPSQSHSLTSQLLGRLVLLASTDDAIINQRKERCSVFCFGFVSPCAARRSESNGDLVVSSLSLPASPPTTPANGRGLTGRRARTCVAIMRSANQSAVSGSDSPARVESSGLHLKLFDRRPMHTDNRKHIAGCVNAHSLIGFGAANAGASSRCYEGNAMEGIKLPVEGL